LAERRIQPSWVAEFGLGYCSWGKYANRVVFPVWWGGQVWYYQARATWPDPHVEGERYLKMLNPPRIDGVVSAEDVLYNLEGALRTGRRLVLVEGPTDALHVGPEAVASFGKRLTDSQLLTLVRAGVRELDLMLDGPSPTEPNGAWPEMVQIARRLGSFMAVRLVRVPQGDPGDWSREENARWRATMSWPAAEVLV